MSSRRPDIVVIVRGALRPALWMEIIIEWIFESMSATLASAPGGWFSISCQTHLANAQNAGETTNARRRRRRRRRA